MKALQPLREAILCELVMADTGSENGSREIAEKYADILFDFPWINNFAAARNAVMDRCCGEWYFSIDCGEWLDEDVSDLVKFLRGKERGENIPGGLAVRNYTTKELDGYSDMLDIRLVRMDTGTRCRGEIHESFDFGPRRRTLFATKTVLHHDGYVVEGRTRRAKQDRNMALLERQVEEKPKDLRIADMGGVCQGEGCFLGDVWPAAYAVLCAGGAERTTVFSGCPTRGAVPGVVPGLSVCSTRISRRSGTKRPWKHGKNWSFPR